ncbi:thioesterase II family protein [Paenibacillus radicis (ex Gao et al. 2016)]|uniref:Thioesterase n=1 Tax=Paenibacillus radicis (ex Gao et al. 2016) TaxID=1737354 RepID=A0A917H7S7_9BACL|nr:alpha/beta fold hydrolase [Paenibacillus radicis (ex Gao et al. 2016)]GGG69824.1 thioesterase [Paenibacillus radicis (ex Gao et al. 2016)]
MTISLICLPYAGGSAQVYKRWTNQLHPDVRLVPAELSGRGSRMDEPFYRDAEEAVQDLIPLVLKTALKSDAYALFGHSMGSLLGYELLHALWEERLPLPAAVFLSARGAPHCEQKAERRTHLLPDDEFLEELKEMGGMTDELFRHKELLDLFMPILRADFKLVCEYEHRMRPPLPLRLTILSGNNDGCVKGSLHEWERYATGGCEVVTFEGGHFFLQERESDVVAMINKTLIGTAAPI